MSTPIRLQKELWLSIWIIALLVAACAPLRQAERYKGSYNGVQNFGSKLSAAHMRQIGDAFIGREVVFRVLWYEYAYIDPDPNQQGNDPPKVKAPKGALARGQLAVAAYAGDTAKITGIQFQRDRLYLFCRKPNGAPVFLRVIMPRGRTLLLGFKTSGDLTRKKITDKNMNAAWLENVLTQAAVEFIEAPMQAVQLSAAPKGLELSAPGPPEATRAAGETSVTLLDADAEPALVRPGETLRLNMKFKVATPAAGKIRLKESYGLLFQGQPLPNFPVQRMVSRAAGEHSGVYRQRIPVNAAQGVYRFKAEVCYEQMCSSRVSLFEIVP